MISMGFTGHEDEVTEGLVNMGGRVYDPRLGRFTTPDPFVQYPFFSQGWNRYAYAFNDPLSFVDPTGFGSESYDEETNVTYLDLDPVTVEGNPAGPETMPYEELIDPDVPDSDIGPSTQSDRFAENLGQGDARPDTGRALLDHPPTLGDVASLLTPGGVVREYNELATEVIEGTLGKPFAYAMYVATGGVFEKAAATMAERALAGVCFAPGTEVATDRGSVPIEDLDVGDFVYSLDPATGEMTLQEVIAVTEREASALVHVSINGEWTTTTPEHPIWTEAIGWTLAGSLAPGDTAWLRDGGTGIVDDIVIEQAPATVFNLELAGSHTFFVSEAEFLVHNDCSKAGAAVANAAKNKALSQLHHIATDKAIKSGFTELFERIFARAGLSMQNVANKIPLPGHAGRHAPAYHQWVLNRLTGATSGLRGVQYRQALLDELDAIAQDLARNPELVRGVGLP
jgi:RHS repeat-associated protein